MVKRTSNPHKNSLGVVTMPPLGRQRQRVPWGSWLARLDEGWALGSVRDSSRKTLDVNLQP